MNDSGPVYGRQAIEKYYADLFQKVHFSDGKITGRQLPVQKLGDFTRVRGATTQNREFSIRTVLLVADLMPV